LATVGVMSSVADRFERLSARFNEVIRGVSPERWQAASPCAGWSALDVVRHVAATEREFLGRFEITTAASEDVIEDWLAVCAIMQSTLNDPEIADRGYDGYFGPTTIAKTVDMFYALDLLVHAWDLARATGQPELEGLDAAAVAHVRRAFEPLGEIVRSPNVFGPAVELPSDASDQDRFLAWTGRHP
jgi:uncharacterized protein (TIGR03086 family)